MLEQHALRSSVEHLRTAVVPSDRRHIVVSLDDLPLAALYDRLIVIVCIVREQLGERLIRACIGCRVAGVYDSEAVRKSSERYLMHPSVIFELAFVIPGSSRHVVFGLPYLPVELHRLRSIEVAAVRDRERCACLVRARVASSIASV